jgi:DNA-binding NarL/FixJ family response regulator
MGQNRSAILSCDTNAANFLSDALLQAGYDLPQRSDTLRVAKLGTYAPCLLVVDFDHIRSDKLESIRQIRFVLPDCAIAVMSSNLKRSWAKQCHMAGANGVFSSSSTMTKLATGLRHAAQTGCYTDPAFAAPSSEN